MLRTILILAGVAITQPANALITQFIFTSTGTVTFVQGPWAPTLFAPNSGNGTIVPFGLNIPNNASGFTVVNDADTYWEIDDSYMFQVSNFDGPGSVGSYTLTNGFMTGFDYSQGDGISGHLHLWSTGFEGWLWDPQDATNNSYYSGVWSFLSTATQRTGDDGGETWEEIILIGRVPEPASWAMMLAGFGLLGGALRTNRRRQPEIAA